MERIKYFDFDLLIERSRDRYRARVIQSPAGQASAEFVLPFTDQDLEILMLRVGRARRGVRRLESPEMQAAKQFGGKLFDAVFASDVRGALRSSIEAANRDGVGLRVRLRLGDAPELVDLPWEFLYNSTLNRFLALSNKTPLVRYIELPETPRPLKIAPPLRVLVMISAPSDYDALDVEQEWSKLNEALHTLIANNMVTLERLETATLGALRQKLRQGQYHVLHFIGHGGFDERAQDGLLVLENEQGRGRPTSGQYLATVLTDHDSLRLVILNACEGARAARTDPFAGVAQSLIQQGIPAVIAMQFEVTDEASITFAHEFYSALSDGYPVDAALGDARGAIFAQVNDLEWGTPVLYLRAADGIIFTPLSPQERAELERIRLLNEQRAREQQAREQAARERQKQIENLYNAAQSSFGQNDFDAAEKSLGALFVLDEAHENARALETIIKLAREQARLAEEQRVRQQQEQVRLADEERVRQTLVREQERLAQEQRVLEQQASEKKARERQQQIERFFSDAQSSFAKNKLDAAEKSLSAIFALDVSNADARELQTRIQAVRERIAKERDAQVKRATPLPQRAERTEEKFWQKNRLALVVLGVVVILLIAGGLFVLNSNKDSDRTGLAQASLNATTTAQAAANFTETDILIAQANLTSVGKQTADAAQIAAQATAATATAIKAKETEDALISKFAGETVAAVSTANFLSASTVQPATQTAIFQTALVSNRTQIASEFATQTAAVTPTPSATHTPTQTATPIAPTPTRLPTRVVPTSTSAPSITEGMLLESNGGRKFWIDIVPLTNAQFAKFVAATNYQTFAEKQGFSDVNTYSNQGGTRHKTVPGANWQHPTGEGSFASPDAPVLQMEYRDANAFCNWFKKRLPTIDERRAAVSNPKIIQPQTNSPHYTEWVDGGYAIYVELNSTKQLEVLTLYQPLTDNNRGFRCALSQ